MEYRSPLEYHRDPTAEISFSDILFAYHETGAVDLSNLAQNAAEFLTAEFSRDFETFDPEFQTQFVEQLMMNSLCSESTALELAKKMTTQQHIALVEFIFFTLQGDAFAPVFQRYSYKLGPELMNKRINQIRRFEPERSALILHLTPVPEKNFELKRNKEDVLVRGIFYGVEPAKRIMEIFLSRSPQEDEEQEKFELENWKKTFLYYAKNVPTFLFPYLTILEERGIFTDEFIREEIVQSYLKSKPHVDTSFFETEEDRNFRNEFQQREIQKYIQRGKEIDPNAEHEINGRSPLMARNNQIDARAYAHIFGEYESIKKYINRDDLKEFCGDSITEFTLFVKLLDFNEKEIIEIYTQRTNEEEGNTLFFSPSFLELKNFLEHAQGKSIEKRIHKIFFLALQKQCKESPFDASLGKQFIKNIDAFLPFFSSDEQIAIIQLLLYRGPLLLLSNPNFLLTRSPEELTIFFHSVYKFPDYCMDLYEPIVQVIKRVHGEKSAEYEKFRKFIREQYYKEPYEAVGYSGILRRVFTYVFSDEEQKQFFHEIFQRKNLDPHFLIHFIGEKGLIDVPENRQLLEEHLQNFPEALFNILKIHLSYWKSLKKVFPVSKLLDLFFAHLTEDQEKQFSCTKDNSDSDLFIDIFNSKYCNLFLQKIKMGNFSEVLVYCMEQRDYLSGKTKNKNSEEKKWEKIFPELEKIFSEQLTNGTLSVFELPNGIEKALPDYASFFSDIAQRDAPEYLKKYPFSLEKCAQFLKRDEIFSIIGSEQKKLAWLGLDTINIYSFQFDEAQRTELEKINPFLSKRPKDAKSSENAMDYYQFILSKIQNYKAYPWYKSRLEEIAERQFAKNGFRELYYKESDPPHGDFVTLVRRVALLENSPLFQGENFAYLNQLPTAEREMWCDLFEPLSLYDLDADFTFDITSTSLAEATNVAQQKLGQYLCEVFEIDKKIEFQERHISLEVIKILTIYLKKTKDTPEMTPALQNFFTILMEEDFEQWKWWGTSNPTDKELHLQNLKDQQVLPEHITLKQYTAWCNETQLDSEELFTYTEKSLHSSIKINLHQAVADRHIEANELELDFEKNFFAYEALFVSTRSIDLELHKLFEAYPILKSDKAKKVGVPEEVLEQFHDLLREKREFVKEHKEKIETTKAWLYLSCLQKISFAEIKDRAISFEGQRVSFDFLFGTPERPGIFERVFKASHPDFYSDIQKIEILLQEYSQTVDTGKGASKKALSSTDAFDLETSLAIGEKPVPTCQSYEAENEYNEGLLSYSLDPNVKIIQIYSEDKKLLARAVLRLLEDQHQKPVLLIERTYSVNAHPHFKNLTLEFAKKKAREMKVPLFSHQADMDEELHSFDLETTLVSRGSRAPFVYTDAGGGLKQNGEYTINDAFRIET